MAPHYIDFIAILLTSEVFGQQGCSYLPNNDLSYVRFGKLFGELKEQVGRRCRDPYPISFGKLKMD